MSNIIALVSSPIGLAVIGLLILVDHELAANDKVKSSSILQLVVNLAGKALELIKAHAGPQA